MDTKEPVKDFATLQREAADRWADNQKALASQLQAQTEQFAQSPDVLMRPDPTVPWSHQGIVCPCGGESFLVQRWVTVSGVRHRFEAICTACQVVRTWDWSERGWL